MGLNCTFIIHCKMAAHQHAGLLTDEAVLHKVAMTLSWFNPNMFKVASNAGRLLNKHLPPSRRRNGELIMQAGTHVMTNPTQRLASETSNVDWFRFWLKGEEDSDPAKAEQYKRWHELRKLQKENAKKGATEPQKR